MNKYVKSVEAALRATAPFVAIPVEGHAPACVRGKLLKGALKGVAVHSVKIITAPAAPNCESGRWLEIRGMAEGGVHTYCKMVVENVKSHDVWKEFSAWTDRERERRIKIVSQGVLNPAERKALKLKEAMAKEEKRRNAELIAAKQVEAEIIAEAKAGVFPEIRPVRDEERAGIMAEYSQFRKFHSVRKRGAVIRWKLKQMREQVKAMTVEKREYEERENISRFARRRRSLVSVTRVLRRKGDALKYAALTYQIRQLEVQFDTLYTPIWREWYYLNDDGGHDRYRIDSFQEKRPSKQMYSIPWGWHDGCVPIEAQCHDDDYGETDGHKPLTRLQRLAGRLKEARASIRALTPPEDDEDEQENELPIAA